MSGANACINREGSKWPTWDLILGETVQESCSISHPLEDLRELLDSEVEVEVVDMLELEFVMRFSPSMLFPELLESLLAS